MDLDRYYELRAILQQWRLRLAESIRRRIEDAARRLAQLQAICDQEGADEPFATWLDRWCRQAAIQFILRILFLRVLEDRSLLGVIRLRNTDGQRMWGQLTRNLGAAHYVQWCFWDAAHLLPELFGPNDYDLVLPDDELVQRFLDDVWRRPDPNRPGWLRFDFRPDPGRDDEGFQTRFIGDLYQELDAEIRDRYALLQTPHFISQFILEHTLLKRFEEKDFRQVTLIDPTCGSGHFLVDAFWMFVERYEQVRGKTRDQLTSAERAEIARTIIETHIFGCDINPYATALARFRLLLAACDYAHPTSLRDFRDLRFNLVTIDSLIPYEKLMVDGLRTGSATAQVLGQPETIERALPVLRRRYDVVVGNPPYIQARDRTKRDLYREHYVSAYGKFGLSAPFTERFIRLAVEGGRVGLINSNAFARRQFGRKLIEDVLPRYDLEAVIDLSGAYIPGHGTPTLILFARNQPPFDDKVLVLSSIKGEPGTPTDPVRGQVWQSVLGGFAEGSEYVDDFVDVAARPRRLLAQHPWQFGGPESRLFETMLTRSTLVLGSLVDAIGVDVMTNADDVYRVTADFARRLGLTRAEVRPFVIGEQLRNWKRAGLEYLLFPYTEEYELRGVDPTSPLGLHLSRYRSVLGQRKVFGGDTYEEAGKPWYEYHQFSTSRHETPVFVAFPLITTHNHFVIETSGRSLFKRSAQILKPADETSSQVVLISAILNSSTVAFCLKQLCFDKRAGRDPVSDTYYEYSTQHMESLPVPREYQADTPNHRRLVTLAEEMTGLADQSSPLAMHKLFEKAGEAYHAWNSALDGYVPPRPDLPAPFTTARELRAARDKLIALRQDIRGRMIFLQEEMDWVAYDMYGLLKAKAPLAEDYLSQAEYKAARLELGQRSFEVAGRGYQGDWPEGYEPPPLPDELRSLTEARIAVIEANPDIALLEDPLYKRRWIPPDYAKEFRQAAGWWLAEKLEWALEQHGRPISLRQWARVLGRDERVNAALEVLTSTPMFDLEKELLKIIRANSVPNRAEHYLKPSGLRKLHATRNTPKFTRKDFSDGTAWKRRGKLNIPRERFIHYAEFNHTGRGVDAPDSGGPWFGWAGWDVAQRADALAFLLDRANRAGWELRWRQCGLRAALRDLLSQLGDLSAADRAEFEAIAGMCGIGLSTRCYCQAYRDGIARGEPGVPGVNAEVLGVKPLPAGGKRSRRGRKKEAGATEAEQLGLDL